MVENEEAEPESGDDNIQLSVGLQTDRDTFLRRTCPVCGLDFKTEANDAELAWLLNEEIKRQGSELGLSASAEAEDEISKLCCPYCESKFEGTESFTEESINYVKRVTYREIIVPMMNNLFGDLADSINGRNRPTGGLISISMSFNHEREPTPPRPIHGPEPADMKIIEFLCCGRKAKILEDWQTTKFCVFCQTEIKLI